MMLGMLMSLVAFLSNWARLGNTFSHCRRGIELVAIAMGVWPYVVRGCEWGLPYLRAGVAAMILLERVVLPYVVARWILAASALAGVLIICLGTWVVRRLRVSSTGRIMVSAPGNSSTLPQSSNSDAHVNLLNTLASLSNLMATAVISPVQRDEDRVQTELAALRESVGVLQQLILQLVESQQPVVYAAIAEPQTDAAPEVRNEIDLTEFAGMTEQEVLDALKDRQSQRQRPRRGEAPKTSTYLTEEEKTVAAESLGELARRWKTASGARIGPYDSRDLGVLKEDELELPRALVKEVIWVRRRAAMRKAAKEEGKEVEDCQTCGHSYIKGSRAHNCFATRWITKEKRRVPTKSAIVVSEQGGNIRISRRREADEDKINEEYKRLAQYQVMKQATQLRPTDGPTPQPGPEPTVILDVETSQPMDDGPGSVPHVPSTVNGRVKDEPVVNQAALTDTQIERAVMKAMLKAFQSFPVGSAPVTSQ